jgi:hypothetical protein
MSYSAHNGNIMDMSDLHSGLGSLIREVDERGQPTGKEIYGGPNGPRDRQEDMMTPQAWASAVLDFSKRAGRNTLRIGGDWQDMLEHVNLEDSFETQKQMLSRMILGHTLEAQALATAVVKNGMRVLYDRGNHDVQLINPELRSHLISEIARIGGLTGNDVETFRQRIAFTGHMTFMANRTGDRTQLNMMFHDDGKDATNSQEYLENPKTYNRKGQRVIQNPLGNFVVEYVWRKAEKKNPNGDNTTASSTKAAAHEVTSGEHGLRELVKLLWHVSKERVDKSPEIQLANALDSRKMLRAWARQTGFTEAMNATLPPGVPPKKEGEYVRLLEGVYRGLPTPIHERMNSKLHFVNALRMLFGGAKKALAESDAAEEKFMGALGAAFPWIDEIHTEGGHDHEIRGRLTQKKTDDGRARNLTFTDTGTQTRVGGVDVKTVVRTTTDATGRMTRPEVEHLEFKQEPRIFEELTPVKGWQ